MRVARWTKNGWVKSAVNPQSTDKYVSRHTHNQVQVENYSPDLSADMKLIQRVQEQIQVGSPLQALDALPPHLQYIIQSTDDWHISKGNKLFRVVDPITQVVEHDEFGFDAEDSDTVLSERPSLGKIYLEEEEDVNKKRANILSNEEQAIDDQYRVIPTLPQLSEETEDKIANIKEKYAIAINELNKQSDIEEYVVKMEEEISKVLGPEATYRLNSAYCGYKYSAPPRKYKFIPEISRTNLTDAAQEREKFFYDKFSEMSTCTSMDELHGPLVVTELGASRTGGYYAGIRGMYEHDRALNKEWSVWNKLDKDDNIIEESAFNKQRKEFIRKLRDEGKDEEMVRKAAWVWFDREKGESEAEYNRGVLVKQSKKWKDSIWKQRRTQALSELFMTGAQWNAIYEMMALIKKRIKLNSSGNDEQAFAIEQLREKLEEVQSLSDLTRYRHWAEHRDFIYKEDRIRTADGHTVRVKKWNTYKFNKSVLDCLSTKNEYRWWVDMLKRRKQFIRKLQMYKYWDQCILSEKQTKLPEVSIICPDPRCDCMGIGTPVSARIKGYGDRMYVKCDGCERKVWIEENV